MKGWFYCDAGYLKKCGELARLAESGRFICAAARLLCNFSLRSSMQTIKNSNLGLNIKQAFYALAIVVVACKCAAPEAR